jgi:16S rRNA (adenine1518-N6/adenine1519-N6)-dimethyltransferase
VLSPVWVERAIATLPDEILQSRPEALYLEDFATIANIL